MILYLFSVRDRATASFGTPMSFVATGQAIRSFSDEVNRVAADNQLNLHSDDFDLYSLGFFDTDSGKFVTNDPEQVAIGKNLKLAKNGGV